MSHYQVDSSTFKLFHNLTDGKMPPLYRNQQTICNYCGNKVKKVNLSRHKKSCTSGTKSCPQCPNFFCKTQIENDHHTATTHAKTSMTAKTKCNICE